MSHRLKVKFRTPEEYDSALQTEMMDGAILFNRTRLYIVVDAYAAAPESAFRRKVDEPAHILERDFGGQVFDDYRYELEDFDWDAGEFGPESQGTQSLQDVVRLIRAPNVWAQGHRGRGVRVAVIDTGVEGTRKEIPVSKRVGKWAQPGKNAWKDLRGHGTMCATIAAGTSAHGGRFDGVAPDAGIISCRTSFYESELSLIYDYLAELAEAGGPIVASNSWGLPVGSPPSPPPGSDFADSLAAALRAGVHVFFSAGNYHELAGGAEDDCSPTSIWLYKCLEEVTTIGGCRMDGSMWSYSSRGPGQHFGQPQMTRKPDLVAPTPENGVVVYGTDIVSMPRGWGTSGSCPQAAGCAALLLSKEPSATPSRIREALRAGAVPQGCSPECEGEGRLDCAAALEAF